MLTAFGTDLIWPTKDTVTIEIPIQPPEFGLPDGNTTSIIPIEFLIIKKRDMKKTFDTFEYLKKFVNTIQAKNLKYEGREAN
jgi:hypothetical protein